MGKNFHSYFWIQKKDRLGQNIVLVDNVVASFNQIPQVVLELKKGEFVLSESGKMKITLSLEGLKKRTIYISGLLDLKDDAERNIAYDFICTFDCPLDATILKKIENDVLLSMDFAKVRESFDEDDFKNNVSKISIEYCNSFYKAVSARQYTIMGVLCGVAAFVATSKVCIEAGKMLKKTNVFSLRKRR